MRLLARSLVLLAAAAAALGGCATAGPPPAPPCAAAFDHADALLRDGLASYVGEIKRYAGARDPELSTAAPEKRTWARADAWTARQRPEFLAACRAWPEDQVRCVLVADVPRVLSACGLEALVTSFTDDVVATFAARPVEPAGAPSR
jgi:hypothetical protein